ncbi:hypothetical protein GW950_01390 [Candidatus Wolfebacteria bacterium]|nr:hypothetical protein [Candidatus Wolfebacteria bacterium]
MQKDKRALFFETTKNLVLSFVVLSIFIIGAMFLFEKKTYAVEKNEDCEKYYHESMRHHKEIEGEDIYPSFYNDSIEARYGHTLLLLAIENGVQYQNCKS